MDRGCRLAPRDPPPEAPGRRWRRPGSAARYVSETDEDRRFDEATFKRVTGDDDITARFMNQDFIVFPRTFKLILNTNNKPKARADDAAVGGGFGWSDGRSSSSKKKDSDPVNPPLFLPKDKGLKDKLKAELPGILAWYVQGCLEWQRIGMSPPDCVLAATAEYRNEQDVVADFLNDFCTIDPNASVASMALHKAFESYCERKHIKKVHGYIHFCRLISKKGFPTDEKTARTGRRA